MKAELDLPALPSFPPEQVVVLCGGRGTRLQGLTRDTLKPLLPVAGVPFLGRMMSELRRFGFRRILLLAAFRSEQIERFAEEIEASLGLKVAVCVEPDQAGTGGALWHARDQLDTSFLLMNGDSWFDINVLDLILRGARHPKADATLALRKVADASRYGSVDVEDGRVTRFAPRPDRAGSGTVNAGVYLVRRRLLDRLSPSCSLEIDILPALAAAGRLAGAVYDRFFIDIGTPASFAEGQISIPRQLCRPAVFFDRDGVLNEERGYVGSIDRFQWLPGAIDTVKRLNDAGAYVFVVTNQAGVARGFYSEAEVDALHEHMQNELRVAGAHVDEFSYCPFHPDGVIPFYAKAHADRKPSPGMILNLLKRWPADKGSSLFVGDKESDEQAAAAAGIRSLVVQANMALEPHSILASIGQAKTRAIGASEIALPGSPEFE